MIRSTAAPEKRSCLSFLLSVLRKMPFVVVFVVVIVIVVSLFMLVLLRRLLNLWLMYVAGWRANAICNCTRLSNPFRRGKSFRFEKSGDGATHSYGSAQPPKIHVIGIR